MSSGVDAMPWGTGFIPADLSFKDKGRGVLNPTAKAATAEAAAAEADAAEAAAAEAAAAEAAAAEAAAAAAEAAAAAAEAAAVANPDSAKAAFVQAQADVETTNLQVLSRDSICPTDIQTNYSTCLVLAGN